MRRLSRTVVVVFVAALGSGGGTPAAAAAPLGLGWVAQLGGPASGQGRAVAVDGAGNVYTTGSFEGTVDFDPGPGVFNLTSAGGGDVYVSKLDGSGAFQWAGRMGGTGGEIGTGVAVDAAGDVYVVGAFTLTADFDPGPGTFNLTAAVGLDERMSDVFVAKLDGSGASQWAVQMGGNSYDQGAGVAVDDVGDVYTTGYFSGTADFDPGSGTFELTSDNEDAFVWKLDGSGAFQWAVQVGGRWYDYGRGVVVDGAGNVYVTGLLNQPLNVDNVFVSKLDAGGALQWTVQMAGIQTCCTSQLGGRGVAVDDVGNVYTTGPFTGTADFDPGPGTFNLTAAGDEDVFVSKLDGGGDFVWAIAMGGANFDRSYGVAVDDAANVYTTGLFKGTADFDPGPGTFDLTAPGPNNEDIFVSVLDAGGTFVWAGQMGSARPDRATAVAVDGSGSVYTTGVFQGTSDFDPGPGVFHLTSVGFTDAFVSKLAPLCGGTAATIVGTAGDDILTGTPGPDVIHGRGGNDLIRGLAGDDVICGGDGNDRLQGEFGDDLLLGGAGEDDLLGGAGRDQLEGGTDADFLTGGAGRDLLDGGSGDDDLRGGDGADLLGGGAGADVMKGGPGGDQLRGGGGDDTMSGNNGPDTLTGGAGSDTLIGGHGIDHIDGGSGTDTCRSGETTIRCER